MFKVKIKKVHKKYEEVFTIGDIVEFDKRPDGKFTIKSLVDEQEYSADDFARCYTQFGNFEDCFEKIK